MELITTIRKPEMRMIFGEREIEIIEKQLLGIRLKPSERTRLSRDIKKKFLAIQLLAGYSITSLKKGAEVKRKIEEMKEHILESEYSRRIKRIVVFGSTVYGIRTFRSDIDIAVEFDEIAKREATEFGIKFAYDKKIQVEVYNILNDKIKKEIDEKGKVIYERKN
jgi:predicted nucleotidyltransferase